VLIGGVIDSDRVGLYGIGSSHLGSAPAPASVCSLTSSQSPSRSFDQAPGIVREAQERMAFGYLARHSGNRADSPHGAPGEELAAGIPVARGGRPKVASPEGALRHVRMRM